MLKSQLLKHMKNCLCITQLKRLESNGLRAAAVTVPETL